MFIEARHFALIVRGKHIITRALDCRLWEQIDDSWKSVSITPGRDLI
jgi:hypothetical protein